MHGEEIKNAHTSGSISSPDDDFGRRRKLEKAKKRIEALRESDQHLKRAQRYLGLREGLASASTKPNANAADSLPDTILDLEPTDSNSIEVASNANDDEPEDFKLPPKPPIRVDAQQPAPFSFDKDCVLIAIDIEAYWRNHSLLTEIGLAILDTRDVASIAPGREPLGTNWHKWIKSRHIRVEENMHLSNEEIGLNKANSFFFGHSETIRMATLSQVIHQIFEIKDGNEFRKVVLVGHDISQDLKYLEHIPFNPMEGTVIDIIDTQRLYHSTLAGVQNTRNASLNRLSNRLGIRAVGMHNAGNDAVYTLQACIGLALLEATRRPIEKAE